MIISKYQDKLHKNNTCTQLILLEAYNSSVHIILLDRFIFKSSLSYKYNKHLVRSDFNLRIWRD